MRNLIALTVAGLALAATLTAPRPASAQERSRQPAASGGDAAGPIVDAEAAKGLRIRPGEAPPEAAARLKSSGPLAWRDASFDRYVEIADLPDLIDAGDLAALTDFGLQLAEGERVLGRKHNSKVTARAVLGLVAALADSQGDSAILKRVEAAAVRDKSDALAEAVKGKLSENRSTVEPWAAMSAARGNVKQFAALRGIVGDVRLAKALKDDSRLKDLEKAVAGIPALSAEQREGVVKLIKAPEARSEAAVDNEVLREFRAEAARLAACILYEHSWGGGATWTLWGADSTGRGVFSTTFMRPGWNDVVSSVWIRDGQTFYGYQHDGYGGAWFWLYVSRAGVERSSHNFASMRRGAGYLFEVASAGNWNDQMSSFKLFTN